LENHYQIGGTVRSLTIKKPQPRSEKLLLDDLMQGDELLFARQPIFDDDKNFYAFELLYRDKDPRHALIKDADKATSSLIDNYCSSITQQAEKSCAKVFINLTRNLLLSDSFYPMEPNNIVIEILEDILVDEQLVERIISLRTEGYQFALDDYEFSSKFDSLLPLMDYIKVELLPFSVENLTKRMAEFESLHLSQLKKRPTLLAEKVESQASYDLCKRLGFDLFQGYFLEKPMPIYGRKI
jgi:EAL and modified HD-GYP domain-containing signal transduction protein